MVGVQACAATKFFSQRGRERERDIEREREREGKRGRESESHEEVQPPLVRPVLPFLCLSMRLGRRGFQASWQFPYTPQARVEPEKDDLGNKKTHICFFDAFVIS